MGMRISRPLLLRIVGATFHLIVLLYSIAIAYFMGVDDLFTAGGLSQVGKLAGLTIGMNLFGAICFLLYRPVRSWNTMILMCELLAIGSSLRWLSIDFVVVTIATFVVALALVLHRPNEDYENRFRK